MIAARRPHSVSISVSGVWLIECCKPQSQVVGKCIRILFTLSPKKIKLAQINTLYFWISDHWHSNTVWASSKYETSLFFWITKTDINCLLFQLSKPKYVSLSHCFLFFKLKDFDSRFYLGQTIFFKEYCLSARTKINERHVSFTRAKLNFWYRNEDYLWYERPGPSSMRARMLDLEVSRRTSCGF